MLKRKSYLFFTVAAIFAAVTFSSCGCNKTSQLLQWRENGALESTVESDRDTLSGINPVDSTENGTSNESTVRNQ